MTNTVNFDIIINKDLTKEIYDTHYGNATYFFVGLKSGAQLINNYIVYSNGRPTQCKQLRSKEEQTIVFNCKSK